jgi:hypothetical protein
MENHENLIFHPFTLIFLHFSKDWACTDLVGKQISLLVIYLSLITFLCEDHFVTIDCSFDCCNGRLCTQNCSNDILNVATMESVLGFVTIVWSPNNREFT